MKKIAALMALLFLLTVVPKVHAEETAEPTQIYTTGYAEQSTRKLHSHERSGSGGHSVAGY